MNTSKLLRVFSVATSIFVASHLAAAGDALIPAEKAKPAPAWTAKDLSGKTLSSDELKGKVVVVDFWATWCPPCVAEIPGYVQLQKKYGEKLVIVGLSLDEGGEKAVKNFAKAKNINYPLALSTDDLPQKFGGIEAIPTTFVIDREGRVRYKKVGAMETEQFEELIKPLLK
jgi:thiol-disulfide isomerase/thioredoxin